VGHHNEQAVGHHNEQPVGHHNEQAGKRSTFGLIFGRDVVRISVILTEAFPGLPQNLQTNFIQAPRYGSDGFPNYFLLIILQSCHLILCDLENFSVVKLTTGAKSIKAEEGEVRVLMVSRYRPLT
jgi:hypothetical protein